VQDRFTDKGDLTNLTFTGLLLEGASAKQAFFSGTLFRDCVFRGCDFSRSDFEGAVFENCVLTDCDLSVADFRSVELARSLFTACSFAEGGMKDCIFRDCRLEHCGFPQQTFEGNRLTGCELVDCNFHRSTMLHDEFSATRFTRTDLADCTSIYHLFSGCEFIESSLNAEAIGLTFGLTRENLGGLGLTWLGDKLSIREGGPDLLVKDLITTYRDRGWSFAAGIMELNFGIAPSLEALVEIFRAIEEAAASPRPLKGDEIRFLARVIEALSDARRLPLLAVEAGLDMIGRASELRNGRDDAAFRPLRHILAEAEQNIFFELDRCWDALARLPSEQPARVHFVMGDEPDVELGTCLAQLHEARGLGGPAPQFVKSYRGSYVEVFWIMPTALTSFVVSLAMVERIIGRLISIRVLSETLRTDKIPPAIRSRILQQIPGHGAAVATEIGAYMEVFGGGRGRKLADGTRRIAEKLERIEVDANI
jgi:uncharacterized protein YjbI with pentapeptide repeats